MKAFAKDGAVPFPRTSAEWTAKANPATGNYFTPEEAERKVAQDVFGHDYATDASGAPVEKGKGSSAQPTAQHQMAMHIDAEARAARGMRTGYTPSLEGAFDPRIQAEIDRQVKAAVAAARPKARKAKARKSAPAEAAA